MSIVSARQSRLNAQNILRRHLTAVSVAKDMPGEVILQAIMDIEQAFKYCTAELYLLNEDGKEFSLCSRENGEPLMSSTFHQYLDGTSAIRGSAASPGMMSKQLCALLHYSARVCRYGYLLQYYRGRISVGGMIGEWTGDALSQRTMMRLDQAKSAFASTKEPASLIDMLSDLMRSESTTVSKSLSISASQYMTSGAAIMSSTSPSSGGGGTSTSPSPSGRGTSSPSMNRAVPGGMAILPLHINNECLVGMLLIRNIDKLPHALYKVKDVPQAKSEEAADIADESPDTSAPTPLAEIEAPEHGVVGTFRDISGMLGQGIFSARMGTAIKDLKLFPAVRSYALDDAILSSLDTLVISRQSSPYIDCHISSNVTPDILLPPQLLAIRAAFKSIIRAIPAVRDVSIWAVDFEKSIVVFEDEKAKRRTLIQSNDTLIASLITHY
jgi:hypothetical protein